MAALSMSEGPKGSLPGRRATLIQRTQMQAEAGSGRTRHKLSPYFFRQGQAI